MTLWQAGVAMTGCRVAQAATPTRSRAAMVSTSWTIWPAQAGCTFSGSIVQSDLSFKAQDGDLIVSVAANGLELGVEVVLRGWMGAAERANEITFCNDETLELNETRINQVPTANADQADVQEDLTVTASGNVLGNDVDPDALDALQVSDAGVRAGIYGSLTLNADGGYGYALDNSAAHVQSLGAGQQVTETFSYTVNDGNGGSATSSLKVTVTGTNDGR
jgi:VCBS repeat-containing protein